MCEGWLGNFQTQLAEERENMGMQCIFASFVPSRTIVNMSGVTQEHRTPFCNMSDHNYSVFLSGDKAATMSLFRDCGFAE